MKKLLKIGEKVNQKNTVGNLSSVKGVFGMAFTLIYDYESAVERSSSAVGLGYLGAGTEKEVI